MLQWMGGSRRKVTTSRKSTQKRQKQYFEQRKRQQQQQQTAEIESYSEGTDTLSQHQKDNRSLDILSLQNLSTVAQEHKSYSPSARENSKGNILTLNYETAQSQPTIQTNKVAPVDPIEFREARTSSGYQMETVDPKNALFTASGSHNKALNGNGDKVEQLKIASEHQLSVLDLLCDDGPNSNSKGNLLHESHVAFSVKGLGEVETETPVHSLQQPCRTFSFGCPSPPKVTRRSHLSKNLKSALDDLESDVDAIIPDLDMPFYGSSLELPLYSRGMMNSFSNPKQKLSAVEGFLQFNDNGSNLKNFFGVEENFYNSEDINENTWNASSGILEDNFRDEGEFGLSCKNWPCQMDSSSADFLNIGNYEKPDFTFEGPHEQKKRAVLKATGRFHILEPAAPYSKHLIPDDHGFTPNGKWYPTGGRNFEVRDATNQPAWTCFVTEDARASLSSLSEESCSSSAVRGEAIKKPPANPMTGQNMRQHGTDCRSPVNKCGVKNMYAEDAHCKNRDNLQQWQNIWAGRV